MIISRAQRCWKSKLSRKKGFSKIHIYEKRLNLQLIFLLYYLITIEKKIVVGPETLWSLPIELRNGDIKQKGSLFSKIEIS